MGSSDSSEDSSGDAASRQPRTLATHQAAPPKWRIVLPGALGMTAKFLAACAIASAAPACAAEEPAPVVVAKKFAAAVKRGDAQAVLDMVESPAAARIAGAAERASDQVGGRRNIEANEMLQIVDVDQLFQVAKAELIAEDGQSATVRLTGADGKTHELGLVNEDGQWHVRVPLPPSVAS